MKFHFFTQNRPNIKEPITAVKQGYLRKPPLLYKACQFHKHEMVSYLAVKTSTKLTGKKFINFYSCTLLFHYWYKMKLKLKCFTTGCIHWHYAEKYNTQ